MVALFAMIVSSPHIRLCMAHEKDSCVLSCSAHSPWEVLTFMDVANAPAARFFFAFAAALLVSCCVCVAVVNLGQDVVMALWTTRTETTWKVQLPWHTWSGKSVTTRIHDREPASPTEAGDSAAGGPRRAPMPVRHAHMSAVVANGHCLRVNRHPTAPIAVGCVPAICHRRLLGAIPWS